MNDPADLVGWPEGSAFQLVRVSDDDTELLASAGVDDVVRPWASVTKMAVAWAVARAVDRGEASLDHPLGPTGSTLAHVLAHASGLGLESNDPTIAVGVRRVYSNVGPELAARLIAGDRDPAQWLHDELFGPLTMTSTSLEGRVAAGVRGSLRDLVRLGVSWWRADVVDAATRDRFVSPFLVNLRGVVPGFGGFDPCEWGLGPEIHGAKHHWMGQRFSARSFGHFGQSGALILIEPESGLVLAATAGEPFGPWAQHRWPTWMDELYDRYAS